MKHAKVALLLIVNHQLFLSHGRNKLTWKRYCMNSHRWWSRTFIWAIVWIFTWFLLIAWNIAWDNLFFFFELLMTDFLTGPPGWKIISACIFVRLLQSFLSILTKSSKNFSKFFVVKLNAMCPVTEQCKFVVKFHAPMNKGHRNTFNDHNLKTEKGGPLRGQANLYQLVK